jgi:predicted AAA+ superfamily ATPase
MLPSFLLDPERARKTRAWDHYLRYGAYPALSDPNLSDVEREGWLRDYVKTYLERDIRDLASFRDLDPFVKLQYWLAVQTACVINASAIALQLGLTVKTVQRYLRYFELSYQSLVLPAWARNANKRLTKAPKIHYLDHGVLKAVLGKSGPPTGKEFESLVIAELYKQARCLDNPARFHHLRSQDGREVDCLIELEKGYLAFAIKMADRASAADARHLRGLSALLDKPLLGSFLLSNDPETRQLVPGITAVNAAYYLG